VKEETARLREATYDHDVFRVEDTWYGESVTW
jgi:hypothetical protein